MVLHGRVDLVATIDGSDYRLAGIRNGEVMISSGKKTRSIPRDCNWRLEGGIKENAHFFDLAPQYTLVRSTAATLRSDPSISGIATIDFYPRPAKTADSYIAAVVWIVGNEPVRVVVATTAGTPSFVVYLSEVEMLGKPATLLWKNGHFTSRESPFNHKSTRKAFTASVLNDATMLTSAIYDRARLQSASYHLDVNLAHFAADAGSTDALRILLQQRPQLASGTTNRGQTPLQFAARKGRTEALALLIQSDSPNLKRENAISHSMADAVRYGHTGCVRILLDAGADPNAKTESGRSLIETAVLGDFPAIADMLLASRDSTDLNNYGFVRLLLSEDTAAHVDIVHWLIKNGVNPFSDEPDSDILIEVARTASGDLATLLLKLGANPNQTRTDGQTALVSAAEGANVEFARVLCEAGADVNRSNANGDTPLHAAAHSNSPTIINLLLAFGANLDSANTDGLNPLEVALISSSREAAITLANSGAELSVESFAAAQVLERAIRFDLASAIASAIDRGWSPNSKFSEVWPAVRVARVFESARCLDTLISANVDVSADLPVSIVSLRELDDPITVTRFVAPNDPRTPGTIHPPVTVTVDFLLDSEGRPLFPATESDDPRIGQEALRVIEEWRFTAPMRNGEKAAARVALPIKFGRADKRIFEMEDLTKNPVPLRQLNPVYPPKLHSSAIAPGFAVVEFVILTDGTVSQAKWIESNNWYFGDSAVDAVSKWVFEPGEYRGWETNVRVRQRINFKVHNEILQQ